MEDGAASRDDQAPERGPGLDARIAHRDGHEPVSDVRYLDVVPLQDGGYRLYYEYPLADQSHELRTELVPAT